MNFWIGLIFFISYIFVASILFIKEFAKNPEKQKLVFGVRNRDQFYDEKYKSTFMDIYNDNRFRTIKIICFFVITGIILLVTPNFILKFSLWLIWLSIGIVVIYIPYISGNKQLKSLKKTMEIKENKKILVDTKKVGKVIYGNKILFFLPLFVEVMCFILGMLFDSDLIKINSVYEETYLSTIILGTYLFVGVIIYLCTLVVNRIKNEIISEDSDVNVNYNRAIKANYINTFKFMNWLNALYMVLCVIFLYFNILSDLFVLVTTVGYAVVILIGAFRYTINEKKIDSRYKKETSIVVDDDDDWIFGLFYYNPNDKRINIKKRIGYGTTVNFGHVVGKIMIGVIALSVFAMVFAVVLLGLYDFYPVDIRFNNEQIVCHQLRDDYKIDFDDVKEITLEEDFTILKAVRTNGVGMSNLLKGNFKTKKDGKIKVFLNPENDYYIKVVTSERTYCISDRNDEETKEAYEKILEKIK